VVTLIGGTALLAWLAGVISEHGVANGFSVLLAATEAPRLLSQIVAAAAQPDLSTPQVFEGVLQVALPVGVLLWSMRRLSSSSEDATSPPRLMLPASGILPLGATASLLALLVSLAGFGWVAPERVAVLAPGSTLRWGIEGALVLVLCPLYAWAFHRPRQVARLWARSMERAGGKDGTEGMEGAARRALGGAILKTLGILALLVLATGGGKGGRAAVDVMALILVAAVLLDVVGEVRFQRAQGRLSSVWPVHRAYAVHASLRVLARAGIPAFPRGLHHRSLGQFFVPFVPVEILVPESRAGEAHAVLEALLLGRGGEDTNQRGATG
jgi:preprotein translocase subunit SecY